MQFSTFKREGGKMIRICVKTRHNKIDTITITGDFFMYPEDSLYLLRDRLVGVTATEHDISEKIKDFFKKENIILYGVNEEDFVNAILKAINV
jgi:hypothetical protein